MSFTFFSSIPYEIFNFLPAIDLAQHCHNPINKVAQETAEFVLLARRDKSAIPYQEILIKKMALQARGLKNRDASYLRELSSSLHNILKYNELKSRSRLHAMAALCLLLETNQSFIEDIFTEFENNLNYPSEHQISFTLSYMREFSVLFTEPLIERLIEPLLKHSVYGECNSSTQSEARKCLVSFVPKLKHEQLSSITQYLTKHLGSVDGQKSIQLFLKCSANYLSEQQIEDLTTNLIKKLTDSVHSRYDWLTCESGVIAFIELAPYIKNTQLISQIIHLIDKEIFDHRIDYFFDDTLVCLTAFMSHLSNIQLKSFLERIIQKGQLNWKIRTSIKAFSDRLDPYTHRQLANQLIQLLDRAHFIGDVFSTLTCYLASLNIEEIEGCLEKMIDKLDMRSYSDTLPEFLKMLDPLVNDDQANEIIKKLLKKSNHHGKFQYALFEYFTVFLPRAHPQLTEELIKHVMKYLDNSKPYILNPTIAFLPKLMPNLEKTQIHCITEKIISTLKFNDDDWNCMGRYISFFLPYLTDKQLERILNQISAYKDPVKIFANNAVFNDQQETLLTEFIIAESKQSFSRISLLLIAFSTKFKDGNIKKLIQILEKPLSHQREGVQLDALNCLEALNYQIHCDNSTLKKFTDLLFLKLNESRTIRNKAYSVLSFSAPRFEKEKLNSLAKLISDELDKEEPVSNCLICLKGFAPYFAENTLLPLAQKTLKYRDHGFHDRECLSALIPFLSPSSLEILLKSFDTKQGNIRCIEPIYIKGLISLFKEIRITFNNQNLEILAQKPGLA